MRPTSILGVALSLAWLPACRKTTRMVILTPTPTLSSGEAAAGPGGAATLGIPPGHLPAPGQCRVWIAGVPPGRQPRPRSRPCEGIAAVAPAGSWIVYRPAADRRLVHVRVVDERRPGVVIRVRIFEVETGRFVREENP